MSSTSANCCQLIPQVRQTTTTTTPVLHFNNFQSTTVVMASSESRRVTDPLIVQQIWAAIQYIRMQKQMANSERIARYMEREHEMTMVEAEKQLEVCCLIKQTDQ